MVRHATSASLIVMLKIFLLAGVTPTLMPTPSGPKRIILQSITTGIVRRCTKGCPGTMKNENRNRPLRERPTPHAVTVTSA